MFFFKCLFFNCLIVFLVNYLIPGVQVLKPTKIPYIQGDLLFAFFLGLLNTSVFPLFKLFSSPGFFKIGSVTLLLNFAAYAVLKVLPIAKIQIQSVEGYLLAAILCFLGGLGLSMLQVQRFHKLSAPLEEEDAGFGHIEEEP